METDCNCLWKPLQVRCHHPPGQARPVQSLPFAFPLLHGSCLALPRDLAACQRFVWHRTKPQTSRALTAATVAAGSES